MRRVRADLIWTMHISSLGVNRDPAVVFRIKPAHLPGLGAKLALWLFVCFVVPAQAQSLFGAIDPFDTAAKKGSPRPESALCRFRTRCRRCRLPLSQQSLPGDLNKPLSLSQLTEIALNLNVRDDARRGCRHGLRQPSRASIMRATFRR